MSSTRLAINGMGTPTIRMGRVTSKDFKWRHRPWEMPVSSQKEQGKPQSWCVVEVVFCLKSLPSVRSADSR